MTVDPGLVESVRRRADLVGMISQTVRLTTRGAELVGLCPFHDERTPSFTVAPRKGFFHCFGCGAHGDAIGFVMQRDSLSFTEAVERLADLLGLTPPPCRSAPDRQGRLAGAMRSPDRIEEQNSGGEPRDDRRRAFELWSTGHPIAGSLAETYLVEARGLDGPWLRRCPALRFAPRLGYWIPAGDRAELIWEGPALLAALQYPDGRFAAVHISYLQADGSATLALYEAPGVKRPAKKVRGRPAGAAIRLTPPAAEMVAGEGIETTASAFGVVPAGWAAYSLDNLSGAGLKAGARDPRDRRRRLPSEVPDMGRPGMTLPLECRRLTYLGDGDTKDLLMLEAKLRRAVRRALQLGLDAGYIVTPTGSDLNDLLRRAMSAQDGTRECAA